MPNDLWDVICQTWDDELLSTEDIHRLCDMIFPPDTSVLVHEEIEVLELCGV